MHSEYHTANGNDEGDGTEEDGSLMIGEFLAIRISQSVHHKDTVIYTDTEDKGGDNDIDEVEAHVEQHHGSQYNHPTEQDGHEAKYGVLDIEVETDEQH